MSDSVPEQDVCVVQEFDPLALPIGHVELAAFVEAGALVVVASPTFSRHYSNLGVVSGWTHSTVPILIGHRHIHTSRTTHVSPVALWQCRLPCSTHDFASPFAVFLDLFDPADLII